MTGESDEARSLVRQAPWWWALAALAIVFLGLNAALLWSTGVRLGGDSTRYISGGEKLLRGRLPGGYGWAYGGYLAVVGVMQGAGAGLPGVVGLQVGIAALAGVALASLGATLGGLPAGVFSAAFLLANPDVIQWHAYILTDSLYISTVVIAVWVVWRAAERGGAWYVPALLVLLPAASVRPTGLLLLPVAGAFWVARGTVTRDRAGLALGTVIVCGAVLLALSPRVHDTMGRIPGSFLRSGRVIWGDPATRHEMPPAEAAADRGWLADLRYVVRYPGATLTLAAHRVVVELAHVRPYYSPRHNVLIAGVLLPLYALAAIGVVTAWRHPLTHLLVAVIAAHLLLVAVSFADYDGRFLLYVLGPFAALAGAGFARLTRPRDRAP